MRTSVWVVLLLALSLPVPGAGATGGKELLLAKVNGERITLDRLVEEFRARHGGHMSLLTREELVRRFLESSIDEHLLVQEGKRLDVDLDPRVTEGVRILERRGRLDALLKERVTDRAVVTDEQVAQAFESLTTLYRIRWIHAPTREETERAQRRIEEGESFAEVAREISIDPSGVHGGDPGPFSWGKGPVELEREVFGMEPGTTSEIFAAGDGFAIVTVTERTEGNELPEERSALERRIRSLLRKRNEERLRSELTGRLRREAGVVIHGELLTVESMKAALAAGTEDPVLARVEDVEIGLGEFAENLDLERWGSLDDERVNLMLRRQLQTMIDDMLLEREGEKTGAGGAKLDLELSVALDRAVLLVLLGDIVYANLKPTAEDLENYYEEHPEPFRTPEQIRVQHIVTADLERAEELRRRLGSQGEAGFAAAASEWSVDGETAKRDGFVGWLDVTRMPEEVAAALSDLEPGDLSEIMETPKGFVLIRVSERKAGSLKSFDEVREEIEKKWMNDAKREKRAYWVEKLREVSKITVSDEAISRATVALQERADAISDPSASAEGGAGEKDETP
jgi:parvulin-like peptidyl-prolyl isomerase